MEYQEVERIEEPLPLFKGSQKRIFEISLVLSSQKIPHRISFDAEYCLWTEEAYEKKALHHWKLYRAENQVKSKTPPPLPPFSWAPLAPLLAPIFVYFAPLLYRSQYLNQLGRMDVEKLHQGEWWRLFTAQTLHADARHIAGNLASGFFLFLLSRKHLPLGWTAFLATLCATAANYTNALLREPTFKSLGYSTVTFSILGLLVGWEFIHVFKNREDFSWKFIQPLAAGFTLTFMMSAGENTDVGGHLFGFLAGLLFSTFFGWQKKIFTKGNEALGYTLMTALYAVTWFLALRIV